MKKSRTTPQPGRRLLQGFVTEDAYLRVKNTSAKTRRTIGEVMSDALLKALPAVKEVRP